MPSLATILVCSFYRLRDIATLFGLPLFAVENYLGPGRANSEKLVSLADGWTAGGNNPFNPALVTVETLAAFQAATLQYALLQFVPVGQTYTAAQVAALFGVTAEEVEANLAAGPYLAGLIWTAAAGYPGNGSILNFADVTPATAAAFFAMGG